MSRSSKIKEYKLPVNYNKLHSLEKREVRDQYVKEQNNLCYWCNESLSNVPPKRITNKNINLRLFPKDFLKYPIHLQHCHKTSMTEGAVHAYCNAVMWQYEHR